MARRRRLIAGIALVAGSLGGALLLRQRGGRGERVDLYLGDGTLRTLDAADPAGEHVLGLARSIATDVTGAAAGA